MPSSLTHYWFAKDVVHKNKEDLPFLKEKQYKYVTYVGTQGPDVLFFYGMVPMRKRKDAKFVQQYGTKLHQQGISDKFLKMFDYANSAKIDNKNHLYAYIFGAMLHYCLDRIVHPYVYYKTGFDTGVKGEHNLVDHTLFESMIDTEVLGHFNTNPYETRSCKVINAPKEFIHDVSVMYAYREEIDSETFYSAWQDMLTAEKMLLDRLHFKRALLRIIGMRYTTPYTLIHRHHKSKKDTIDYLNVSKQEWHNPANNQVYHDSFWDLYELAFKDSETIVKIMQDFINGKDIKNDVIKFCQDQNYNGLFLGETHKYYKSVYKEGD